MTALALEAITKSFGATPVLQGVDLDVADGEFVAVVGPSGCGKSTLLRVIAGLENHYSGTVRIRGKAMDALPPGRRDVAMVFQSYALYPHMTVAENIALPLVMRRLNRLQRLPVVRSMNAAVRAKRSDIAAAVSRAAGMVSLDTLLDRRPKELSGGQRQRVALARALVREPQLFLLDEPLSNLDANLRGTTRAEIVDLQRKLGIATLLVTHDQTEAMTMADRIVVLMAGTVVQVGTAYELYESPLDIRVARFIGSQPMNLLPAESLGGAARTMRDETGTALAEQLSGAATIGIRAEHLETIDPSGAPLTGCLRRTEYLGADRFLHVTVVAGGSSREIVVRASPDTPSLSNDTVLGLGFSPSHLHLFDAGGRRIVTQLAERSCGAAAVRIQEPAL